MFRALTYAFKTLGVRSVDTTGQLVGDESFHYKEKTSPYSKLNLRAP